MTESHLDFAELVKNYKGPQYFHDVEPQYFHDMEPQYFHTMEPQYFRDVEPQYIHFENELVTLRLLHVWQ